MAPRHERGSNILIHIDDDWWVYFIIWRLREHGEREQHKERTTSRAYLATSHETIKIS